MSRPPHPMMEALLNSIDGPGRVIAHMVPTRIIRILDVKNDGLTFRVEQLIEHSGFGTVTPRGAWRTLSTHTNPAPGGALGVAFGAAHKAQQDLIAKLKRRIASRQPTMVAS